MREAGLIWRWFQLLWRGDRLWMLWLLLGSLISSILLGIFPFLWQFLVDELRAEAPAERIIELGVWILGIGVGQALFYMAIQWARAVINARIQVRTRALLFDHLTRQPADFFSRWSSGDLVTRLSDDAGDKTAWFLCSGIFRAAEGAMVVAACLAAMLWTDPGLTAWVVLPLPLLIGLQALIQGALSRRFQAVQGAISDLNDQLTTTFSGIRIVRACALEPSARARFEQVSDALQRAEIRRADLDQATFLMYGHGWQMAAVLLLFFGGERVISGELSLGAFVSFEGFVMTLIWPMFEFGTFVSRFLQSGVAFRRLQEVMDAPPEQPPERGIPLQDRSLRLSEATVSDLERPPRLGPLSLQIASGERAAVVGEVGAGKSTLLHLLTGAEPPTSGSIWIGRAAPAEADRAQLRALVAYVPQDPVLIAGTVRDNILLGRQVSPEDLAEAVRIARLEQDLPQLPDGMESVVGERGVTLSGGQQQRVALARALVGRPSILLLDDATAALDARTEDEFWRELGDVLPEVTAVVVTHRLATLERADRILVLEGGRLVQEGKHADLLSSEGPYRRIYGQYQALAKTEV